MDKYSICHTSPTTVSFRTQIASQKCEGGYRGYAALRTNVWLDAAQRFRVLTLTAEDSTLVLVVERPPLRQGGSGLRSLARLVTACDVQIANGPVRRVESQGPNKVMLTPAQRSDADVEHAAVSPGPFSTGDALDFNHLFTVCMLASAPVTEDEIDVTLFPRLGVGCLEEHLDPGDGHVPVPWQKHEHIAPEAQLERAMLAILRPMRLEAAPGLGELLANVEHTVPRIGDVALCSLARGRAQHLSPFSRRVV